MIIKLPKQVGDNEELFSLITKRYIKDFWSYFINSKYRTSVGLVSWIKEQVDNAPQELIDYANNIIITDKDTIDEKMLKILNYVRNNFEYHSDQEIWGMGEHWNTAVQSVALGKGDCEDGAILIYVLARLHGIPSNRLMLFAGDVNGGGHCWLGYRPSCYPINFVFLDWCYWYNAISPEDRNKFYIDGTKIIEYKESNGTATTVTSNYYKIWFAFNEDASHSDMSYQMREYD